MKGIYYIENSVDERTSRISGYFQTEEEAREALKECSDWFMPKGTGTIWFKEFGLNKTSEKIYADPDW
jgi:hypothetical protein